MEWLNVYLGLPWRWQVSLFWLLLLLALIAGNWIRDRLCLPSHPDMEEMLRGMYRQDRAKEE